jgi:subtilisin-like proprotein convertase family protein
MQKFYLLFVLSLCIYVSNAQNFWTKIDRSDVLSRNGEERSIIPDKYEIFRLDVPGLKHHLMRAPLESMKKYAGGLELEIPMPNGRLEKFLVYESPVMGAQLSEKFPEIRSYIAAHAQNKGLHMRFTVSPKGFHAAIEAMDGEKYIDPYSSLNGEDHIVYNVKDHKPDAFKNLPICGNDESTNQSAPEILFNPIKSRAAEVNLRVFKLAMACTGEWGQRRGTVAKCLEDMNIMVTRMNAIYERELSMRFVLIDDNDKLIFLDPSTDPYNNSDQGKVILGTNTSVINPRITGGSAAYDIGHVLSICFDIGGVAQGGSACQNNKGNGVTCNNDNDLSGIVTRVMAHEVGHQFNAGHTWNICQPNDSSIATQRSDENSYEPGSGSTIMSYAGSCGSDNVLSDNDDYFHVRSLEQIYAKTYTGGNAFNCSDKIPTGNHFPVIEMPTIIYTIPITTPFELKASATDEDNDNLTYCWEQYDLGPAVALGTNSATGPLFRSFKPTANGNVRFVPEAASILTGKLTEKKEVLPNQSRQLNWKFTVRDNHSGGAGVQWDDYRVNVTENAGPFKLIYPLLDDKFVVGQEVKVTWEVANTDQAPVNCKFVNIYGSYTGALRNEDPNLYPLALNVPNDGSETVFIPNKTSNLFRIVIKAADNIFLTSSILPSKITEPVVPTVYFDAPSFLQICKPNNAVVDIKAVGYGGLTQNMNFEIISALPDGVSASFEKASVAPGEINKLTISSSDLAGSFVSTLTIRSYVSGVDTLDRSITIEFVGGDIHNISVISPPNGMESEALPKFVWNSKKDATSYRIQVSKDPAFDELISNAVVTDTNYTSTTLLDHNTIYFWRVLGINKCGESNIAPTKAFKTMAFACNLFEELGKSINIANIADVEFPIDVTSDGIVSDVNVKLIKGDHQRVGDLVVNLVSPSGKEVLLWNRKCGTNQNINVGVDDQSPAFFSCPINTGKVYRPEGKLSNFNGDNTKGTWKLKVSDQVAGAGGKLVDFKLELCSSINLKNPYITKHEILKIYPGDLRSITNELLLVVDDDDSPEKLTYKLVSLPSKGDLYLNGQRLSIGATFTQLDINNSKVDYKSLGSTNDTDSFDFIVVDNAGGWLSITSYNIDINAGNPSSTSNYTLQEGLHIYPNPTSNTIFILKNELLKNFDNFTITDLSGRKIMSGMFSEDINNIDLSALSTGAYLLKISDGRHVVSKKLLKL